MRSDHYDTPSNCPIFDRLFQIDWNFDDINQEIKYTFLGVSNYVWMDLREPKEKAYLELNSNTSSSSHWENLHLNYI